MGKINLHIANASHNFTDKDIATIQSATRAAEDFISKNLNFDYEVDFVVVSPSLLLDAIPEDGIVGRTYSSRLVVIVLNKEQAPIREDIVFETICHEMSHSMRWAKNPEYTKCLFDEVILEGLAVNLEEKAINDTSRQNRQFFLKEMQSTSQEVIDKIIAKLGDKLHNKQFAYYPDYYNSFFYAGNKDFPRWAGYRLGYYLVKKHLAEKKITIGDATIADYSSFKTS